MSTPPTLVQHAVKERQQPGVGFDLDMDITDKDLDLEMPLSNFPWPGRWNLSVDFTDQDLNFYVWRNNEKDAEGEYRVKLRWELFWIAADKKCHPIKSEDVEAFFPGYDPEADAVDKSQLFAVDPVAWMAAAYASLGKGLNLEQLPHDIRLFFPRAHSDGAALWARSDFLARSFPYLKDLLAANFAEFKSRRSKRVRRSGAAEVETPVSAGVEKDFADSDDETDAFLFSKRPPKLEQSSEADEVSYRQVTITQTAFSTYHAILIYLQTGFIHFTPLTSSFPFPDFPSRTDFLSKSLADKPYLPLPVSPKSAYRLAHLLQLDHLKGRALDAIYFSLSAANVAAELFSDTAIAYDEVRAEIAEVLKANWEVVKETDGWKERVEAIGRDEIQGGAAVLIEMLKATNSM
ncbi:hypothetical protein JCM6882_002877 [Rhodosporidiobolus microsporus]